MNTSNMIFKKGHGPPDSVQTWRRFPESPYAGTALYERHAVVNRGAPLGWAPRERRGQLGQGPVLTGPQLLLRTTGWGLRAACGPSRSAST